jgi:hypothetical protein
MLSRSGAMKMSRSSGGARETVQVQRDGAEDHVASAGLLEGREDSLGQVVVHAGCLQYARPDAG